jgi:hypothetical protein
VGTTTETAGAPLAEACIGTYESTADRTCGRMCSKLG